MPVGKHPRRKEGEEEKEKEAAKIKAVEVR
jgi:hypothetical protein